MLHKYGTLITDISDAIYDWLNVSLNGRPDGTVLADTDPDWTPVRLSRQGGPRPSVSFAEFDFLTGFVKRGAYDELVFDEDLNKFKLTGEREVNVTVNFIGADSAEMAAVAQQSLDSPDISDILRAVGLTARRADAISNRNAFLETMFEDRNILDVQFGLRLDLVTAVSNIELVEITSGSPGGSTTVITIE